MGSKHKGETNMNPQNVNELTYLYTALNPTLQAKKSTHPEIRETSPVLIKIENWLEKSVGRIREGIGNPVKDSRMLTTK
jgi:hypothetical protein